MLLSRIVALSQTFKKYDCRIGLSVCKRLDRLKKRLYLEMKLVDIFT